MLMSLSALVLLTSAFVVGQRPFFAGSRPIGFPSTPNRTTTTPDPLGNRFGEGTTERLPIEANGDRDLIDRLSKLPIDKQPFWFINWKALEEHRKNPQTYPLRPNVFVDPIPQNTNNGINNRFSTQNTNTENNANRFFAQNTNTAFTDKRLNTNTENNANRFFAQNTNTAFTDKRFLTQTTYTVFNNTRFSTQTTNTGINDSKFSTQNTNSGFNNNRFPVQNTDTGINSNRFSGQDINTVLNNRFSTQNPAFIGTNPTNEIVNHINPTTVLTQSNANVHSNSALGNRNGGLIQTNSYESQNVGSAEYYHQTNNNPETGHEYF